MKVAMIGLKGVPALYGGVERHVEELATRIAAAGHDVVVYCRRHYTPPASRVPGITIRRLPSINSKHLDAWTHTLIATLDAAGRDYDLLHYHALGPATFVGAARLAGQRTVVTVHGLDWQREKWGRVASWYLKAGERAAARWADGVIVVSRELQRHFAKRWGVEATYIPNAVNLPAEVDFAPLDSFGLKPGGYVLAVGRLVPEKGMHLLIEAFRRVEIDLPLVIIGDDPAGEYVAALKSAADERVAFLGYVYGPPLAAFFAGCRVYVHPSTLEGLSIALLEAMSYGAPIIASDIPANAEALGEAGYYFRSGDVSSLREVLRRVLGDAAAAKERGRAARERALALYSWEEVARRTLQVYESVLGSRPSSLR